MEYQNAQQFSMKDNSSKPFAWTLEGIEVSEIVSAESYAREYTKNMIATCDFISGAKPAHVYRVWRANGEYNAFVNYVKEAIANEAQAMV